MSREFSLAPSDVLARIADRVALFAHNPRDPEAFEHERSSIRDQLRRMARDHRERGQ